MNYYLFSDNFPFLPKIKLLLFFKLKVLYSAINISLTIKQFALQYVKHVDRTVYHKAHSTICS